MSHGASRPPRDCPLWMNLGSRRGQEMDGRGGGGFARGGGVGGPWWRGVCLAGGGWTAVVAGCLPGGWGMDGRGGGGVCRAGPETNRRSATFVLARKPQPVRCQHNAQV